MPAVPLWSAPAVFDLTNPFSGILEINSQQTDRLYLLDQKGCKWQQAVRATVDHVPQADGDILHRRFLTGVQIQLTIQLWEDNQTPACDELLAEMVDELSGAFRSLLNAGDNAGRLRWQVAGQADRILDDARLLIYPDLQAGDVVDVLVVTIDSQYPYAQDLTQIQTNISDGGSATLDNTGTADYFPVFKVYGPGHGATPAFELTNETTGIQIVYDETLPGGIVIPAGSYAEIDTFRNTIYLNGSGTNLKAGISELDTDFWALIIGENDVTVDGGDVEILWAPAYG